MTTSPRHARLESTLHREVQRVLTDGLSDPRLDGVLITVMGVSVDDPGTTAVVRVALRPDKKMGLAALTKASAHIARQASKRISTRRMPRLIFREDRGLRKETEVLEALAQARAEYPEDAADSGANDLPDPPVADAQQGPPTEERDT